MSGPSRDGELQISAWNFIQLTGLIFWGEGDFGEIQTKAPNFSGLDPEFQEGKEWLKVK